MLPIYYNRLVQEAICNSISSELNNFFRDRGYTRKDGYFQFFTFSRLLGNYYLDRINKKIFFKNGVKLFISSPIKEFCNSIKECMLDSGQIRFGPVEVEVTGITVESTTVSGESVVVDMVSPLVVSSVLEKPEGGEYIYYFRPGEKEFTKQLEKSLRKKYHALYGSAAPEGKLTAQPLSLPRLSITVCKDTVIKGYICRLKLTGPGKLLQIAVDAGLGVENSLGFGCVEIVKNSGINSERKAKTAD